jgi:hypothetical protein
MNYKTVTRDIFVKYMADKYYSGNLDAAELAVKQAEDTLRKKAEFDYAIPAL